MASSKVPLSPKLYSTVYPFLSHITRDVQRLSYDQRSWLIKCCQAQKLPHNLLETDTLHNLGIGLLPFTRMYTEYPMFEFLNHHPLTDMPPSIFFPAFMDCLRGIPFSDPNETLMAREKSISNEISLSEWDQQTDPLINFSIFFSENPPTNVLHPSLPPIPVQTLHMINTRLRSYRHKIQNSFLFPKYSHKNMSRSTRRDAESHDINLDDVPIYGQDNWIRLYHEEGIKLGGVCEIRQKIYPANLKPRTYYAMGGEVYDKCRHLSSILIDLCDMFMPTHRLYKLRVDRLTRVSDYEEPEEHYHVYDLSSFTSNFTNQRAFTRCLQEFFRGVIVEVVDEHIGPISRDLGDLFEDYIHVCSEYPRVSYERFGYDGDMEFPFGSGSLLGIFGNMPLANLAHFLIMFSVIVDEAKLCVAGDDGAVFTNGANGYDIYQAIHLVGDCVAEKTFDSFEEAPIFLKRPLLISQETGQLALALAFIPPCVATSFLTMSDRNYDDRYVQYPSYAPLSVRVSKIGVDLLRYLSSIFMKAERSFDLTQVAAIYEGYCKLVLRLCGSYPSFGVGGYGRYTWPAHPLSYEFFDIHPLSFIHMYGEVSAKRLKHHERVVLDVEWLFEGASIRCNMTKALKLACTFGYMEAEMAYVELEGEELRRYEMMLFGGIAGRPPPAVYEIRVIKDMPEWIISLIRQNQ
jgi:hypothetical protein